MSRLLNPGTRGIAFAFLTFFCFGITNFLLGYIAEKAVDSLKSSLIAPVLVWLGMGVLGVIFLIVMRISGRRMTGFSSRGDTLLAMVAGIILALAMMSLKIGFVTDPSSKGPITAVTSANSIVVALMAWWLLKEKLSFLQWTGILVTLGGIATMALAGGSRHELRGIFFGIIALMGFGITNTILKWIGHHGMNSITAAMVIWLTAGGCGMVGAAVLAGRGFPVSALAPAPLRVLALAAGVFLGLGMWSLKRGVTVGTAGPVVAVASANALLVAFLDFLVFHHAPGLQKLLGMATVIGGVMILSLFAVRIKE